MSILSDGTIKRTINKQAPYLWAVVWRDAHLQDNVSVFSFWEDANHFVARLHANGFTASLNLAVDDCRTFSPKGRTANAKR